jgi:hypothetical protein
MVCRNIGAASFVFNYYLRIVEGHTEYHMAVPDPNPQ